MGTSNTLRKPASEYNSFLPNFCQIRLVFAVVVSAELLALILTLGSADGLHDFADELSLRSLLIQWIALAGTAVLCLVGGWLRDRPDWFSGLFAWALLQLITLLVASAALVVLGERVGSAAGVGFLLECVGISAITAALLLRYLYMQQQWRRQMEAESDARFQALQSRIRPHFLFNSMNTIASLTRSDPALAEEIIQDLADLFRASLGDSRRKSTLGDELDLARGYLRIEGQRLGPRLRVVWDLEQLPEQAGLPALVLQPLLENAVYHGVEPSTEPGSISVAGRYRRHRVNLSIRNSLPPTASRKDRPGNRLALENVRQRLQGFFSGEAQLLQGEVDGEYQVRLVFPYPFQG